MHVIYEVFEITRIAKGLAYAVNNNSTYVSRNPNHAKVLAENLFAEANLPKIISHEEFYEVLAIGESFIIDEFDRLFCTSEIPVTPNYAHIVAIAIKNTEK